MAYIERETFRDRMESVDWYHVNDNGVLIHGATSEMESYLPTKEVYRVIDEAPTADVVEVVRCKDCEYYKPQNKVPRWNGTSLFCTRTAVLSFPPDGFCSFGKRRESSAV